MKASNSEGDDRRLPPAGGAACAEGPTGTTPIHLGVTEAGDGEDGRIKSAIGIGSLLADGIGDTIRVSLTEDSVHEIPVAQSPGGPVIEEPAHPACPAGAALYDPFSYRRRACRICSVAMR